MAITNQTARNLLTLLVIYYQVYRWVPLKAWNGQFTWPVHNDQFYPDIVIGLLILGMIYWFTTQNRAGMWASVVLLGLWVVVHFFDWWFPYLQNRSANLGRYNFYRSHTQLLPIIDHHYPPDGGHTLLDFILYPTFMICLVVLLRTINSRRQIS